MLVIDKFPVFLIHAPAIFVRKGCDCLKLGSIKIQEASKDISKHFWKTGPAPCIIFTTIQIT